MADWQRTLPLKDVWPSRDPKQIAAAIAERLPKLRAFDDPVIDDERDMLVDGFKAIADNPSADVDDFDRVLERLYDWGDQRLDDDWNGQKVCWVQTF